MSGFYMNKKSILVVAAHPDDEVLGCGGSIARHTRRGDTVSVLILADGVGGRIHAEPCFDKELSERRACAERANAVLGVNNLTLLAYPDNCMDTVPLLKSVQDIEQAIARYKPCVVYTHHASDVNIDHRCVHDAVIAACRPQPGHCVRQLLFFETPSSTEWRPPASQVSFSPNWFVDISGTLSVKLQALAAYASELREFPHPRSLAAVEHLARWRGASAGFPAAEAFSLGRMIQS